MNNGSGVSNFSSVSNINHILNAHHQIPNHSPNIHYQNSSMKGDKVLEDIDKVLSKVQKSGNMPTKSLEKILEKDYSRPNKSVMP